MKTNYVVKINRKKGGSRYLRVFGGSNPQCTLIISKSAATRVASLTMANILSDYFWKNHWILDDFDSREIAEIRVNA